MNNNACMLASNVDMLERYIARKSTASKRVDILHLAPSLLPITTRRKKHIAAVTMCYVSTWCHPCDSQEGRQIRFFNVAVKGWKDDSTA